MPFGFSGITIDRQGNNVDAELIFGNNDLARSFADRAISQRWMATVYVVELRDLDNPDDNRLMYRYIGQVTSERGKTLRLACASTAFSTQWAVTFQPAPSTKN